MSNKAKRKVTDFKVENFPFLLLLCFVYVYEVMDILSNIILLEGFPGGSVVKNKNKNKNDLPAGDVRDVGCIPGLGRSPGE